MKLSEKMQNQIIGSKNGLSLDDSALIIQRLEKAAESGDTESMMRLGDWYGNVSMDGQKEPRDPEKARKWYLEVVRSGSEQMQLRAARALDEICDENGRVIRPALDMKTAYFLYRQLAAKDREAMILTGNCFEKGKGVPANLDMALMWYERAGDETGASRCRRRKTGMMEDTIYSVQAESASGSGERNGHSHGKEYYRENLDFNKFAYRGRFYYVNSSCLCSSDFQGEDVRILFREEDNWFADYASICVNTTGIYLYYLGDGDELEIKRIGFDGKLIREEKYKENIRTVYIYDDRVYYSAVRNETVDRNNMELTGIWCLNMTTGEISVLYQWASSIDRLYANGKYIVFHAEFCIPVKNMEIQDSIRDDGWLILDLKSGTLDCLSSSVCSPINVFIAPELYDENSHSYLEDKGKRIIPFVDLDREVFWVEKVSVKETFSGGRKRVRCWEPRAIEGNREQKNSGLPVWIINEDADSGREYFDGIHRYLAPAYHTFQSADASGTTELWSKNTGHGECDKFTVWGDFVFLNIDAFGEKQYPLQKSACKPIRRSWFSDPLPAEAVEKSMNRERAKAAVDIPVWTEKKNVSKTGNSKKVKTPEEGGKPTDTEAASQNLSVIKKIGETDLKYKICTFGAKFHIGFGVPVTIIMNGKRYSCRTHKSAKGRIDGLKQFYAENDISLGDEIKAVYSPADGTVILEKI